jgi:hypothetical protein
LNPSFWPDNLCDWMEVSNFSHWKASEHTGPGDLTMVLKQAVENRLNEKGIQPEEYVKINVDKKMGGKEVCHLFVLVSVMLY